MLKINFTLKTHKLLWFITFFLSVGLAQASDDIQFNTDVLDLNDRANIDLGQFSQRGFIMPGVYPMVINLNKQSLPEQSIAFYPSEQDDKKTVACITPSVVELLGLKEGLSEKLTWWHQEECLDMRSLKGMEARGDLAASALYLSLPQAYLEYVAPDWDPPSTWDEGIPGALFDYNINAQTNRQKQGANTNSISGNGVTGINLGPWRLRGDWQANYNRASGKTYSSTQKSWDWSRYYAYRAITSLRAKLTLGEDFLNSGIFDSFRFTGASLVSDDSMLPPNLRGYAPEVVGIAKTNAKVTISQQGRVIHESQVAAGPFHIQDINDSVSGKLDVRIEEQDGSVQSFQMDTASIPYLTRPGSIRYKLSSGKPSDWQHHSEGPTFAMGEFSWGVANGWSMYGGAIAGGDYNALSLGIGRDLMAFGAISFDGTQSRANLPDQGTRSGGSYRVSYSKNIEQYDSQVTFAGYRFSQRNFMSMSEYLDARYHDGRLNSNKEMYTATFSKQFRDVNLSSYLNYSHQTYWDQPANDRFSLSVSRYFDLERWKNLSLSLSAYRNKYNGVNDDGMYLSLAIPFGSSGTLSYNASANRDDNTHSLGFYDRIDSHNNYQLSTGISRRGGSISGNFNHEGDIAQMNANASYQNNQYTALGLSLQGGMTATVEGAALHRVSGTGGTRLMMDTGGVAGIPVRGYGATTDSNRFGKVVVADVNNYYRNNASIDLNNLSDNIEVTRSVAQATLTEGAIGYRRFEVISGQKAMAVISLADGSTPPFGATVVNSHKQETGIVNDGGSTYLSGIKAGENMLVRWGGKDQCAITLPASLPEGDSNLLLPCESLEREDQKDRQHEET